MNLTVNFFAHDFINPRIGNKPTPKFSSRSYNGDNSQQKLFFEANATARATDATPSFADYTKNLIVNRDMSGTLSTLINE